MDKVLKVARTHMLSLICAVIALVAVILAYYPTGNWYTQLQAKVDQCARVNTSILNLLKPNRHVMPILKEGTSLAEPLPVFPTDDVYKAGLKAVLAVHNQSTDLLDLAKKINQHIPLDPTALPAGDDLARTRFRAEYLAALVDDVRFRTWPPENQKNRAAPLMPGKHITQEEIDKSNQILLAEVNKQYLVTSVVDNHVTPESLEQAKQVYDLKSTTRPLALQRDAAHKCKVYLEAGAIDKPEVYAQFVSADTSPRIADVWAAQLALWVDEDAVTGVAQANAAAQDVTESPVKQILKVTLKIPPYAGKDDPKSGGDDSALPQALDVSPTGRECNGMYDVVHFDMTLDVDANRIPEVLDALERGQFITVLSVKITAGDTSDAAKQRYIYGSHPIARINLTCEELFLHDWLKEIQPPNTGPVAGPGTGFVGASSPGLSNNEQPFGEGPRGRGPRGRRPER